MVRNEKVGAVSPNLRFGHNKRNSVTLENHYEEYATKKASEAFFQLTPKACCPEDIRPERFRRRSSSRLWTPNWRRFPLPSMYAQQERPRDRTDSARFDFFLSPPTALSQARFWYKIGTKPYRTCPNSKKNQRHETARARTGKGL